MAIPTLNNAIKGLIMASERPQNDLSIAINSNPMVLHNLELMEINDGNDVGSAGERKRRRNQLPRDEGEGVSFMQPIVQLDNQKNGDKHFLLACPGSPACQGQ